MLNLCSTIWRTAPVLAITLLANSAQAEVWVITDAKNPVTGAPANARIIRLDSQQLIEEQLSRELPPNPHQAALAARRLISTPAGSALMQQLAIAQQGNADAWSVGASKVPAVVVDRRYVVYGQPDVAAAMQVINRARGQ